MKFTYEALPGRVVFGIGAVGDVRAEVARLGIEHTFVIADAQAKAIGDDIVAALGPAVAVRWDEVAQHVPVELAERARAAAAEAGADGLVCVGGGSSTGLAKAIALTSGRPILAVPTTYAGSEMTPIYGLTGQHKQTGRSVDVVPKVVVYDPALTVGLPAAVTGPSGFNALAHCVEALYGPGANPVTSLMALEGIGAIGRSLAAAVADGSDLDARTDLLYGAWLAGVALGATGTALHHKVCHALGGTYDLVHGDVNAVMLPHAVAYNTPGAREEMGRVASALGVSDGDAAGALYDLAVAIGAPTGLEAIGMPYEGLDEAAERTVADTTVNPVPVTVDGVRSMLERAWKGTRPA
ncbi:MAG TPA: maleylacetate reductase [Acidimicrobiales bacterium]